MDWWATQPEAWAATRADCRDPGEAMPEYVRWLKSLPGRPVFVGYPASYDFMFVYWYLIRFAGESPFSLRAAGSDEQVIAEWNRIVAMEIRAPDEADEFGE